MPCNGASYLSLLVYSKRYCHTGRNAAVTVLPREVTSLSLIDRAGRLAGPRWQSDRCKAYQWTQFRYLCICGPNGAPVDEKGTLRW